MAAEDYIDFDDYCEDSRDPDLRDQSGRSIPYLREQARIVPGRHGGLNPLPGAPNNGAYWTDDDEIELASRWDRNHSIQELAHYFGRTKVAIIARLTKLGLDPDKQNRSLVAVTPAQIRQIKKASPMTTNVQHLIALLQKGYTTVEVVFLNQDSGAEQTNQTYTYKVPEAVAKTLVKGDLLVVPARKAFAVVKVSVIHETPKINVREPLALRWIVQKVDTTQYDDQAAREKQAVEQVEVAERRQAQEAALQTLLGSADDREAFLRLINGG